LPNYTERGFARIDCFNTKIESTRFKSVMAGASPLEMEMLPHGKEQNRRFQSDSRDVLLLYALDINTWSGQVLFDRSSYNPLSLEWLPRHFRRMDFGGFE
jgi:hypothetical protein